MSDLDTARPSTDELERQLEDHRRELTGYCYRMLGSSFEAEDAVQETMVRAWRSLDRFEGRSSLRSWLYKIATNVCFDMLNGTQRRARPMDLGAEGTYQSTLGPVLGEATWVLPIPDSRVVPDDADPAEQAVARESIRLAFVNALTHLPAKQRAVLILREVLRWKADEVAELLDTSTASVNSALQRARATLREHLPAGRADWAPSAPPSEEDRRLLRRYMAAVDRGDLVEVAALLAQDVRATMPPYPEWFDGRESVVAALAASWDAGSPDYIGTLRAVATSANGQLAAASYRRPPGGQVFEPFGIGLLRVRDGRISEIVAFHEPALFPAFGLPQRL
jgi:RNA polymerase sigma-70 factor, ECF subfamily